jgi:cytochrome c-type biogenesis protein CcmH/NrfG
MLAMCYMERGTYPQAIAEFNKVIESMPPTASTFLHVKYELARAHMENKDFTMALELFAQVEQQDASFKDVSEKVESLKSQVQQEPSGRRDRVSYI